MLSDYNTKMEILFITSYPPRECGIATYSNDLIMALNEKFDKSFTPVVCALESGLNSFSYAPEVKYVLNTSDFEDYMQIARDVNSNENIGIIMLQHEFGFFNAISESEFLQFLSLFTKPIIITFHTVLPDPSPELCNKVKGIIAACKSVVVMTQNSAEILINEYKVEDEKIDIIPHGIHLVAHLNKESLKAKYGLKGRKILSTFGLISSGKSIETTLNALPAIVENNPDVLFLAIGKTHPDIVRNEGEIYRQSLEQKVIALGLQNNVKFINKYLPLSELLEYLQLSDIYLFTSKDPHQAVSGTFSYALSCCCPIISTPIPHAKEIIKDDAGLIIDFENPAQLSKAVNLLLGDADLRTRLSNNGLQRIVPAAWENVAMAYGKLFKKLSNQVSLKFKIPALNLNHIKQLTTSFGMIQFSKINQPDLSSGYTLDDNARAMIALCMHYEVTRNKEDLFYISTYLQFIRNCQQTAGDFLNYIDENKNFTDQNNETNLEDSNGRAIWALGYLISLDQIIPDFLVSSAKTILQKALPLVMKMHSTRAMAFSINGLYYYNSVNKTHGTLALIEILADRLVNMYKHESCNGWEWYESYLTYGNSILPEALLCAYLATNKLIYKDTAYVSFNFLLSKTFHKTGIKPISNKTWLSKGKIAHNFGEQPIDVAYTIMALDKFNQVFKLEGYQQKLKIAFYWFLGNNHLGQIIYNPCTGGSFDGLEEFQVNLNQGAESTLSYLMARLTLEKYVIRPQKTFEKPDHRPVKPLKNNWLPAPAAKISLSI